MTTGIYKLNFMGTTKVYIGKSLCINERYRKHLNNFKLNKAAIKLQEAYNQFGIPQLEILCECTKEELNQNENEAIEIFDAVNDGFNTLCTAEESPSEIGEKNSNSKYSNEKIIEVFKLLINNPEKTFKEISAITKVPTTTISGISGSLDHLWLEELYPEDYIKLKALKGNRRLSKNYHNIKIVSPKGQIYTINNISHFAQEHSLGRTSLSRLLKGVLKTHKGWVVSSDQPSQICSKCAN